MDAVSHMCKTVFHDYCSLDIVDWPLGRASACTNTITVIPEVSLGRPDQGKHEKWFSKRLINDSAHTLFLNIC